MCGRFTLAKKPKEIAERFQISIPDDIPVPAFNAAPGQLLPVISRQDPDKLVLVRWGLSAPWLRSGSQLVINARSETLASKRMFRELLETGRCLVPADGFYEWRKGGSRKQPYRFTLQGEKIFAFAGLMQEQTNDDGEETLAFTILTTDANELVAGIHNRMPVILPAEAEKAWIEEGVAGAALQELLRPYPAGQMHSYTVSPGVNNARVNHPGLIDPWKDNTLTLF